MYTFEQKEAAAQEFLNIATKDPKKYEVLDWYLNSEDLLKLYTRNKHPTPYEILERLFIDNSDIFNYIVHKMSPKNKSILQNIIQEYYNPIQLRKKSTKSKPKSKRVKCSCKRK